MDVPVEAGEPRCVSSESVSPPRGLGLCDVVDMESVPWACTRLFGLPFGSQGPGFPRDLTRDGDIESNPGPDLWCGQLRENRWGTRIMSLHEDFDVVDRWVWKLAFVSNQRVISLPVRRWSLLQWDSEYVFGI